ncbi:MAG: wax ester/triacylglycerol synthase family O-acyltransferase [SAR324 cluster bacterium]|nr:wax ester/triacylglycerol synthase family O-acyltransferase [SAR324 cluster bacterium]
MEKKLKLEKMEFKDKAWLRMENPRNLMTVTGVMMFDEMPDRDHLVATLKVRLLSLNRFRQKVIKRDKTIYWEEVPDSEIDFDYHLKPLTLADPGDDTELEKLVGELASSPLDYHRPLWQMFLVSNYHGTGAALVVRINHAIADGISLIQVLISLMDNEPNQPVPTPEDGFVAKSPLSLFPSGSSEPPEKKSLKDLLLSPFMLLFRILYTIYKAFFLLPDTTTILKGELTGKKGFAWSKPIPLNDIKDIGRSLGGKLNDVILTIVTEALRQYLKNQNAYVEKANIRVVIPVNVRPLTENISLGNRFGSMFLALPLSIEDQVACLNEVQRRTQRIKNSFEALVLYWMTAFSGTLTKKFQMFFLDLFTQKSSLNLSNVPGPKQTLYVANVPMQRIIFCVPQPGRLAMGVSILSYNNNIMFGVTGDLNVLKDPHAIVRTFEEEVEKLKALANIR